MTDDYGRRLTVLEKDMSEVQKCIVRLEAHEEEAIKHRHEVEKVIWKNGDTAIVATMGRIEDTIAYMATSEAESEPSPAIEHGHSDAVTWKVIGERLLLPLVVGVIMLLVGIIISGAI